MNDNRTHFSSSERRSQSPSKKICLYCRKAKEETPGFSNTPEIAIASKNFATHIKVFHQEIYNNKRKTENNKRERFAYGVDWDFADNQGLQSSETGSEINSNNENTIEPRSGILKKPQKPTSAHMEMIPSSVANAQHNLKPQISQQSSTSTPLNFVQQIPQIQKKRQSKQYIKSLVKEKQNQTKGISAKKTQFKSSDGEGDSDSQTVITTTVNSSSNNDNQFVATLMTELRNLFGEQNNLLSTRLQSIENHLVFISTIKQQQQQQQQQQQHQQQLDDIQEQQLPQHNQQQSHSSHENEEAQESHIQALIQEFHQDSSSQVQPQILQENLQNEEEAKQEAVEVEDQQPPQLLQPQPQLQQQQQSNSVEELEEKILFKDHAAQDKSMMMFQQSSKTYEADTAAAVGKLKEKDDDNDADENNLEVKQKEEQEEEKKQESETESDNWKTWIGCRAIKTEYKAKGDKAFMCKGEDRKQSTTNQGYNFSALVKTLIQIGKRKLPSEEYIDEVVKKTKNYQIQNGFVLLKTLGAGNVGTTFLAEDQFLKRKVALKVYHKNKQSGRGSEEFKMMKMAENCSSIVKAYNLMFNQEGTFIAISMENLSSYFTFYRLVHEELQKSQELIIARNCCRAVAELHEINVVHGDLSSENILVCYNDESFPVKIIDFDCASIEGHNVKPQGNSDFVSKKVHDAMQGKVSFIASEKKNDIYSLTMLLYLLLGDSKGIYMESIATDESISHKAKEKLIFEDEDYLGYKIVQKLLKNKISVIEAAEELHELIKIAIKKEEEEAEEEDVDEE